MAYNNSFNYTFSFTQAQWGKLRKLYYDYEHGFDKSPNEHDLVMGIAQREFAEYAQKHHSYNSKTRKFYVTVERCDGRMVGLAKRTKLLLQDA